MNEGQEGALEVLANCSVAVGSQKATSYTLKILD